MNTGQTVYEQLQEKIGNYMQHGGAIEGGGWKVYDPISLSRVLSALGEGYTYYVALEKIYDGDSGYIPRKLLTEDGSDAMLSDQSPETIKAIWEIVFK